MMRLNKDNKARMAEKIVNIKFLPRKLALVERMKIWANKVYEGLYTVDFRTTLYDLPDQTVPTMAYLWVMTNSGARMVRFDGNFDMHFGHSNNERRVMLYHANHSRVAVKESLARSIESLWDDIQSYQKEYKEAYTIALKTINQFMTSRQLREAWPEVADFLPAETPKNERLLPVVQREDLNKRFGLPVEKQS